MGFSEMKLCEIAKHRNEMNAQNKILNDEFGHLFEFCKKNIGNNVK